MIEGLMIDDLKDFQSAIVFLSSFVFACGDFSETVHWVAQPRAKRLGWVVRSTTRSNIIIAAIPKMAAFFSMAACSLRSPCPCLSVRTGPPDLREKL
jgi:hypothetical protein